MTLVGIKLIIWYSGTYYPGKKDAEKKVDKVPVYSGSKLKGYIGKDRIEDAIALTVNYGKDRKELEKKFGYNKK
ncbi:MAG: hypothetical protein U9O94_07990 [Nanoarchaeota archaeon]|nr:hypothetical protein [Nanoarchaeota archaeon]